MEVADLVHQKDACIAELRSAGQLCRSIEGQLASCESTVNKVKSVCNLGMVHSTIKWVAERNWWVVSRCLKQCFLD